MALIDRGCYLHTLALIKLSLHAELMKLEVIEIVSWNTWSRYKLVFSWEKKHPIRRMYLRMASFQVPVCLLVHWLWCDCLAGWLELGVFMLLTGKWFVCAWKSYRLSVYIWVLWHVISAGFFLTAVIIFLINIGLDIQRMVLFVWEIKVGNWSYYKWNAQKICFILEI